MKRCDVSLTQTLSAEGNVDDDEESVEEAVEADELLVYDPANDDASELLQSDSDEADGDKSQAEAGSNVLSHYWWVAGLPICSVRASNRKHWDTLRVGPRYPNHYE